ncbi:MAG: hypothetical protein AB2794_08960 [Candidatus Thiodiazotropha endolucinida]
MEDDYQKYNSQYSVSYMSNSKWLRLFKAVAGSGIEVQRSEWHFIDSDNVLLYPMPQESQLMAERFKDGLFQPFEYKWIKSIFIPSSFKPTLGAGYTVQQDTAGVLSAIQRTGQFATELTENGLWIHAYKK